MIGSRPRTEGLHPSVVPEVLLCAGILTGWLGSRHEVKEADGYARDLITESIRLYEESGDSKKVAEARTELAYCYWRAGAHDEARILFSTALERLTTEGNTRANALLGPASLLGISYQRLARIIETRHADLLKERSPVHRRPRKSFIKDAKVRSVSQT